MANVPESENNHKSLDSSVTGETLKTRDESEKVETQTKDTTKVSHSTPSDTQKRRLFAYRPSHKATFIGLGVVILIIALNAGVLLFLLQKESSNQKAISNKSVTISPATLNKLGVTDAQIGNSNEQLSIGPNTVFGSNLTVAGSASIGGQLHLNAPLTASSAILAQLQAGNTSVSSLNINGSATASSLSVRNNLSVGGAVQFQNTVTVAQLLTVDSSAAVANNLSVGGELSANTLAGSNLVISGIVQAEGHIVTTGSSPAVGPAGPAIGSNGTVSLSGNDMSGIIDINVGANPATSGAVAHIAFHSAYGATPVVVISPLNRWGDFYVANLSTGGFDIYTASALNASLYQLDYMVEQ